MGGGTLADGSIWSRGGTPDDFKRMLFGVKEDKITSLPGAAQRGKTPLVERLSGLL